MYENIHYEAPVQHLGGKSDKNRTHLKDKRLLCKKILLHAVRAAISERQRQSRSAINQCLICGQLRVASEASVPINSIKGKSGNKYPVKRSVDAAY